MNDSRREAGLFHEEQALAYLQNAGLQPLMRNYRCRTGEIDLVMREGNVLVLVEVRFRNSLAFGGAAASVDARKQRRLYSAARHLIHTRAELRNLPARFDIVAIETAGHHMKINWIKDAFRA